MRRWSMVACKLCGSCLLHNCVLMAADFPAFAICDATRVSDGTSVALKFIHPSEDPYKIDISSLSSEGLASDPRNHCIPIYEVLIVPDVKVSAMLVMPLLRTYNDPPFQTFGEAVDFMRQLIEARNINVRLSLSPSIGGF